MPNSHHDSAVAASDSTAALCGYLSAAATAPLPAEATEAARGHLLDTIAAIVSGSALPPGRRGTEVADSLGGPSEALVVGSGAIRSAYSAALANGFAAHADETDDSHAPTLSHPGCAVVPAVLAVAEKRHASGTHVLAAVAAGYDAGCRVGRALGPHAIDPAKSRPSSHAIIGCFGAAAGAAVIERFGPLQMAHALGYAAQSASGVTSWQRDPNHVQKAFVFAGMPASSGVLAATMVSLGLDGVSDPFDGQPNFLDALSAAPERDQLAAELGSRYEVCLTNIKKYAVASPAQAAVQAAETLSREHTFRSDDIVAIEISLPSIAARIVDNREMSDVNVQYLVAGTLADRRFSFAMAHDASRMYSADIARLRATTSIVGREDMNGTRSAILRVHTAGGDVLTSHVPQVRGTVDDPMTMDEIETKAADLMDPILGKQRSGALIAAIRDIETIADITAIRPLLTVGAGAA